MKCFFYTTNECVSYIQHKLFVPLTHSLYMSEHEKEWFQVKCMNEKLEISSSVSFELSLLVKNLTVRLNKLLFVYRWKLEYGRNAGFYSYLWNYTLNFGWPASLNSRSC